MNPISTSLISLQGAATAPAARTSVANGPDAASAGPVTTPAGSLALPPASSVMLSQVLAALRVNFSISSTSAPASAALTPAENASQNFSAAIAQAVQSGDGSDDSMAAVRGTVLQALGDVSQFLIGAGAAPADVGAAGSDLRSRLDALMSKVAPGSGVAGQATLTQQEKATLQIRTAEGDLVTLRIRARSSTTASLAAGAGTAGAATGAASLTTVNGARISVDVQGNISADEAAAIGDVVRQVEALANQFFAGDVTQAFASAGSLQIDSTQLASVALRVRFSTSFSAIGVATAPAAATPATTPATIPATTPAATPPLDASAASTPATSAAGTVPIAAAGTAAASGPSATAPATSPAPTPASATPAAPQSIMSILQDFLKQVLDFALSGTGDVGVAASVHLRLKLLLSATQTLAPASGTSSAPASAPAPAAAPGTPSAATVSGGAGMSGTTPAVTAATSAAPVAAEPADPARAITMLGVVLNSLGRLLA